MRISKHIVHLALPCLRPSSDCTVLDYFLSYPMPRCPQCSKLSSRSPPFLT
jgi:hypothetical protein